MRRRLPVLALVAIVFINQSLGLTNKNFGTRGLEKLKDDAKKISGLRQPNGTNLPDGTVPIFEDALVGSIETRNEQQEPAIQVPAEIGENIDELIEGSESRSKYDITPSKVMVQGPKKENWQDKDIYHKKLLHDPKRTQSGEKEFNKKEGKLRKEPEPQSKEEDVTHDSAHPKNTLRSSSWINKPGVCMLGLVFGISMLAKLI